MTTASRGYTPKQMGDACEMIVAAELTLAGMPAMTVPPCWPHYDVVAQPPDGGQPQRISVKSRTFKKGGGDFVWYAVADQFDWWAIVLLPGEGQKARRIFLIPRTVADTRTKIDGPTIPVPTRYWRIDQVEKQVAEYENNFGLSLLGKVTASK